jgi:hypothetical protein
LNLFLGVVAFSPVSLPALPEEDAQEKGNRDKYGKVVGGPIKTTALATTGSSVSEAVSIHTGMKA